MAVCCETKVGEVYVCEGCGWEVEVKKVPAQCGCKETFSCCGKPMVLKSKED